MNIKNRILKHIQYESPDTRVHIRVRSGVQQMCFREIHASDHIDELLASKIVPMLDFETSTIHTVQTML